MSEETNKKLNEELTDEKTESAAGGGGGYGMYRKTCPVCGRSFGTYGETYCSKACREKAKFLYQRPFWEES